MLSWMLRPVAVRTELAPIHTPPPQNAVLLMYFHIGEGQRAGSGNPKADAPAFDCGDAINDNQFAQGQPFPG